jgi:hypothetical protein
MLIVEGVLPGAGFSFKYCRAYLLRRETLKAASARAAPMPDVRKAWPNLLAFHVASVSHVISGSLWEWPEIAGK